ncbi:MAG: M28 family peptidase [Chitinophagaceae bacterium]|nr:M28 family peptidase [Chitinophagaceae bacterium]
MKHVFLYCLLSFCLTSLAQDAADPSAYGRSIQAENLEKLLYTIAGKEMEGRETATAGQRRAAQFIENYFKSIGLLPAWDQRYQQSFPIYRDSLIRSSLSVNGTVFQQGIDFAASDNSDSLFFHASEVVFMGYGVSDSLRDDYKDLDVRGKIALIIPGFPSLFVKKAGLHTPDHDDLQETARQKGAGLILIADRDFPRIPIPSIGSMYVNDHPDDNVSNTFYVSYKVARAIMGPDFKKLTKSSKKRALRPKTYYAQTSLELDKKQLRLESSNVLGYIEGTDKKEEAVVITAHYDHLGKKDDSTIYYGADDDGSGTVAVMEMAKAFAKSKQDGHGPRRSIVFMTVSGEEKGLWGSSYYSENPAWPLDKTTVNINIDMIGRTESKRSSPETMNYLYVIGDNRLSSDLRPISEETNDKYTKLYLDYRFNAPDDPQRIFYRSDHYNFAKKGVPVIFYFNGLHEDYHRPGDTPDKINYPLLQKRAQLIFHTAWEIANRDEMLKRDLK